MALGKHVVINTLDNYSSPKKVDLILLTTRQAESDAKARLDAMLTHTEVLLEYRLLRRVLSDSLNSHDGFSNSGSTNIKT